MLLLPIGHAQLIFFNKKKKESIKMDNNEEWPLIVMDFTLR